MRRAAAILLLAWAASAGEPDARGSMQLALDHGLLGFDHARLTLLLLMQPGPGEAGEERRVVVRTAKVGGALDRAVCFLSPADLRNTAFLSLGGAGGGQFLYLPELGRVRQVSRARGSEPFLGTTFSFRDVEGVSLDDAVWTRLPDESVGKEACEVIEGRFPAGLYGRMVSFLRKSDRLPLRVRFFDRDDKPAKTLFTRRIGQDPAGRAYAEEVRMEDLRTGASTVLRILAADFADRTPSGFFTPEQLARGVECAP